MTSFRQGQFGVISLHGVRDVTAGQSVPAGPMNQWPNETLATSDVFHTRLYSAGV